MLTFRTGGVVIEFEERHALFGQPGKLRLGAFGNRARSGNYREALGPGRGRSGPRHQRHHGGHPPCQAEYGFYANLEQQIATDIGLFARASWNDGHNEILSFTDIDRSVSAGVSVKGSYWGRPRDTFGLGGAVNGLSACHRDFLAAGGLELLIGDGRLNYSHERILESYYAFAIDRNFTLTADYQFIANPAYNADRGPVSIFSGTAARRILNRMSVVDISIDRPEPHPNPLQRERCRPVGLTRRRKRFRPRHRPGFTEARIGRAVDQFSRPQRGIQPGERFYLGGRGPLREWIGLVCCGCSSPAAASSSASACSVARW